MAEQETIKSGIAVESVPAAAFAAGTDGTTAFFTAPFAGNITAASFVPAASLKGQATNNRTISVHNVTQAEDHALLTTGPGVQLTAGIGVNMPLTGAVAVAAGDVIQVKSTHNGTGQADPGGQVTVTLTGTSNQVAGNAYYQTPGEVALGSDALHLGGASI